MPWYNQVNRADEDGGCVYTDVSTHVYRNTLIADNDVDLLGGGVYCWVEGDPTLPCCTITGNGGGNNGGNVVATNDDPSFERTIITFATEGAGILCFASASPTFVRTLIGRHNDTGSRHCLLG